MVNDASVVLEIEVFSVSDERGEKVSGVADAEPVPEIDTRADALKDTHEEGDNDCKGLLVTDG